MDVRSAVALLGAVGLLISPTIASAQALITTEAAPNPTRWAAWHGEYSSNHRPPAHEIEDARFRFAASPATSAPSATNAAPTPPEPYEAPVQEDPLGPTTFFPTMETPPPELDLASGGMIEEATEVTETDPNRTKFLWRRWDLGKYRHFCDDIRIKPTYYESPERESYLTSDYPEFAFQGNAPRPSRGIPVPWPERLIAEEEARRAAETADRRPKAIIHGDAPIVLQEEIPPSLPEESRLDLRAGSEVYTGNPELARERVIGLIEQSIGDDGSSFHVPVLTPEPNHDTTESDAEYHRESPSH